MRKLLFLLPETALLMITVAVVLILCAQVVFRYFIGTSLEADLRARGDLRLVVAGVITNNSVEATVHMTGNLGFETWLVEDAGFTFDRVDFNGVHRTADEVHAMSLANLDGEYCSVIRTRDLVA